MNEIATMKIRPFLDNLRWSDAGLYPLAGIVWLLIVVDLVASGVWWEAVLMTAGAVVLGAILDYKERLV